MGADAVVNYRTTPDWDSTAEAIARARPLPVVDRVFPFEQARDAYQHSRSGAHFGKVVVAV